MIDSKVQAQVATSQTGFYADSQRLSGLKGNPDDPESIKEVAKEFEALFLQMMLKSMREAEKSLKSDLFNSNESEHYQTMQDQQMAFDLSQRGGMGLTDAIADQLGYSQKVKAKELAESQEKKEFLINNHHFYELDPKTELMPIEIDKPPMTIEHPKDETTFHPVKFERQPFDVHKVVENMNENNFKESPRNFVQTIWNDVQEAADKLGVDPKVLVAQAALETGWGKHIIEKNNGASSYNLFNIKSTKAWEGEAVKTETTEFYKGLSAKKMDSFRAYANFAESLDDYVNLLQKNPRYQVALDNAQKPEAFIASLKEAGFATDPNYTNKIMNLYHGDLLASSVDMVKTLP